MVETTWRQTIPRRGHSVGVLEATDHAQVHIGDGYYGQDIAEQKRAEILRWLNPPTSTAPVTSRREPGTNSWFVDTEVFRSWHDGSDPHMLVHGIVGCGKTTLANTIGKTCANLELPGHRVITFYFSSTVNEQLDLTALLLFLVAQLCVRQEIPLPLRDLYNKHNRSYPATAPSDDELEELVSKLLSQSPRSLYEHEPDDAITRAYLIIDGLDEIRVRATRRTVLQYLNRLCALDPQRLRILCTSRSEADILSALRTDRGWKPLEIPKDRVRADIEVYVRKELQRHEELDELDQSVQDELLARLAGPSQVM